MSEQSAASAPRSSLLVELVAALAFVVTAVAAGVSTAAFVFTGSLSEGLPRTVGAFVLAEAVLFVYVGWRSQFVPVTAYLQETPAVVIVAVGSALITRDSPQPIADFLIVMALTTLTTGVVMWAVGRFALGNMVRYVPSTVVSAFVGGSGWLITKGSFEVMLDQRLSWTVVDNLFDGGVLLKWLPGLLLGVVILLLSISDRVAPLITSATVVASVGLFYAAVAPW
ncbi:MAG: hypothetical protein HKN24_00005, partial [Acidimicrobiales bacterium]|nr:hypothetical protein [Acidimicrobiales bacterium]